MNPGLPLSVNMGEGEEGRVTEGDLEAFVSTGYPRLVAALTLICGSRAAAEDAVQEALARAWERAERGGRIDSLAAWVTAVSLNLARSRYRRLCAEHRAYARAGHDHERAEREEHDAGLEGSERAADVRAALVRLPRRQRELTVMRYFYGLEVKELAAALRISEGTVKSALHQARHNLAVALATNVPATEEQDFVPDR